MLQDACGFLENQAGAIHFAKDFHAVLQSFKFHTKDSKCLIFRFPKKYGTIFLLHGFFRCRKQFLYGQPGGVFPE